MIRRLRVGPPLRRRKLWSAGPSFAWSPSASSPAAWLPALASILVAGCASIERAALPAPTLLEPRWTQAAPTPSETVDHAPWDAFLAQYLSIDGSGVSRLDYAAVTDSDRAALDAYLTALQATEIETLSRDEQLAFWINLYNALTVAVVLDAYPVESIRQIDGGLLGVGPWNRQVATVAGRPLSLNDIEHRIIRPVFQEPRIHYAVNCAAVGCPNLKPEAWRAETLEADLAAAEAAYVNDPRGVDVDARGRLTLSRIYVWFAEDFGDDEAEILGRLAEVAAPALRAKIEARGRVDRYAYDWALNDAATAP